MIWMELRCDAHMFNIDNPKCTSNGSDSSAMGWSLSVIRASARATGWTRIEGRDVCPHCTPLVKAAMTNK